MNFQFFGERQRKREREREREREGRQRTMDIPGKLGAKAEGRVKEYRRGEGWEEDGRDGNTGGIIL